MIAVEIADLIPLSLEPAAYVVLLLDRQQDRCLAITMGGFEGQSLERGLNGSSAPRPLTHQLMAHMLQVLGAELEEVCIVRWEGATYYATAQIRQGEDVKVLDCRPSDALNLAVLAGRPIYVSEEVFAQGGRPYPEEGARWRGVKGS